MSEKISFPHGSYNANVFNFFNAVAFQVIMGAPIILYAKSVHASSTVLGIMASFPPLMTVFQLPSAQFLPRYGYKKFVLMGWGIRTVFVFLIALIPIMTFLDDSSAIALMLAALFFFNLIRGISSCAWYPWIVELIPESIRGRFLSRDQFCINLGCLIAMLASALVMHGKVYAWEYSVVFLISALGGTVSIYFMRRIPDVALTESVQKSSHAVPWGAMLAYPPFLRLMCFNVLFMFSIGGLSVFTVEYLQQFPDFSASLIMMLSSLSFSAALLSMPIVGRLIDELGSKFILRCALGVYFFVILGWLGMAGKVLPSSITIVAILNFMAGLAAANFNLANVRMSMSTMPVMGRNHFFALFTVVSSLGLGAAPVLWGIMLDALGTLEVETHFLVWRRHSIYFAVILILNVLTFFAVRFLREGRETKEDATVLEEKLRRMGRIVQR